MRHERGTMTEPTKSEKSVWVASTYALVARKFSFLSEQGKRLVLSHWAYESGFGSSRAAKHGNNLGNLTAGSAWHGDWTPDRWTDVGGDSNGLGQRIDQVWRAYPSVDIFATDYWNFLGPAQNHGVYTVARNHIERGRIGDFAIALRFGGARYYELPPEKYRRELLGKFDEVSILLEAPRPPAVPPVVPLEP